MEKPLVTILSPVYNGETYISRFLDSVLEQDYSKIKLIIVNDGSTDKTDTIIKKYIQKLNEKLISFKYLIQENAGVAAAIENGLQYIEGEYLTWPDSDDILMPDSISKKVEFLEKNKQYGVVRTEANIVDDNDLSKVIGVLKRKDEHNSKDDLFMDYLFEEDIYYAPICYMVRTKCLLDVLPNKKILRCKYGQNWQLFLPIFNKYKCGFIPEKLAKYAVRDNSISHTNNNLYEKKLDKCNEFERLLLDLLDIINCQNKDALKNKITKKYSIRRFHLAIENLDYKEYQNNYLKLKQLDKVPFSIKLYRVVGLKNALKSKKILNKIRRR